jgi:hypothetical protein
MTWPAVVAWILIVLGLLPRSPLYLLYLYFALGPFASLSLLGEASVPLIPQACCGVFLVCKILFSKGQLSRAFDAAIDPARLGLLFAFLVLALFSAYEMPRLFAHMVEVIPTNPEVGWATMLEPTSANISQSAYMTLSVGIALVFALSGENASFRHHYMRALWVGTLVLIATGLADITLTTAGLAGLLEPFRNAYAQLNNVEGPVLGKRVVGLTSEASVYGMFCVAAAANLAFLRPCFANVHLRNYLLPLTILGLLIMVVVSTSSSAYVGAAVFAMVYAVNWLRRAFTPDAPAREGLKWEAIFGILAAVVILAVFTLVPNAMDPVTNTIDEIVFKKSQTSSYIDRNMWTSVALNAFFATHGLGVGLGSVRTSNWFVNILSSTGVIGAVLLGGFILLLYVRRCRAAGPREREFATALKFAMVPQFATAALIGTTPDFGGGLASEMGLITSLTSTNVTESSRSRPSSAGQVRVRSRS